MLSLDNTKINGLVRLPFDAPIEELSGIVFSRLDYYAGDPGSITARAEFLRLAFSPGGNLTVSSGTSLG